MFGYDEADHLATPTEACREWAWNVGEDYPSRQWLLTDYDTWERNPHYHGEPQEHPYDTEARIDAELAPYVAPVELEVDDDLPF